MPQGRVCECHAGQGQMHARLQTHWQCDSVTEPTLYSLRTVCRMGSTPAAAMARRAGLCGVEPSRTSTARANSAAQMTCCGTPLCESHCVRGCQQVASQACVKVACTRFMFVDHGALSQHPRAGLRSTDHASLIL